MLKLDIYQGNFLFIGAFCPMLDEHPFGCEDCDFLSVYCVLFSMWTLMSIFISDSAPCFKYPYLSLLGNTGSHLI